MRHFYRPLVVAVAYLATFLTTPRSAQAAPWEPANTGLPDHSIGKIVVDPTSDSTLYSLTGRGVFKSIDSGKTWSRVDTGADPHMGNGAIDTYGLARATALVVDPQRPQHVYAGTGGTVYVSVDGGHSWKQCGGRSPDVNAINTLALGPGVPHTLYVGTQSYGLAISADECATWTKPGRSVGLRDNYDEQLAIDPAGVAYLATHDGISKSTDGGRTWSEIAAAGSAGLTTLILDPKNPRVLYGGGTRGVLKSDDAGATWSAVGPLLYVTSLAMSSGPDHRLFAATQFMGLQSSNDGGDTWAAIDDSLPKAVAYTVTVDNAAHPKLYQSRADGTFRSVDGGRTWQPQPTGAATLGRVSVLAFDPKTRNVAYVADNDRVFRTIDGGQHWQPSGPSSGHSTISALAIAPSNSRVLYLANVEGVLRTSDGGRSWVSAQGGLPIDNVFGEPVHSLAVDPAVADLVYAGVQLRGVFRSSDGGRTWTATAALSANVFALVVDSQHTVYARTYDSDWRGVDRGATWQPRQREADDWPLGRAVTIETHGDMFHPVDPTTVLSPSTPKAPRDRHDPTWRYTLKPTLWTKDHHIGYAVERGVFKTTDGGATWHALATPPGDQVVPTAIAIDPFDSRVLLLGTSNGVFRSSTGGER